MAQVSVAIAGRTYRMACADGEEEHLAALAARLDGKIGELRAAFGAIGDGRITVMAALTIADQLDEAERRAEALEAENARLRRAGDAHAAALVEAVAEALVAAAARVERVARALERDP